MRLSLAVANRFFTRRSTENVSAAAKKKRFADRRQGSLQSSQPYEAPYHHVRGKYFFDVSLRRPESPASANIFFNPPNPNTFSGFSYGRRAAALLAAEYRSPLSSAHHGFLDFRADLDYARRRHARDVRDPLAFVAGCAGRSRLSITRGQSTWTRV